MLYIFREANFSINYGGRLKIRSKLFTGTALLYVDSVGICTNNRIGGILCRQCIKFNTEHNSIEEADINSHKGLCIDFSNDEWVRSIIIWDNGDYVIEIGGDLTKNSVMDLAKSTKVLENQQIRLN